MNFRNAISQTGLSSTVPVSWPPAIEELVYIRLFFIINMQTIGENIKIVGSRYDISECLFDLINLNWSLHRLVDCLLALDRPSCAIHYLPQRLWLSLLSL